MLVSTVRQRIKRTIKRALGARRPPVWHHASYRLPSVRVEGRSALEPRRADFVAYALHAAGACELRTPARASYRDLARVHTTRYLESLQDPLTLARIFALDSEDVRGDELMNTMRLACGGTLAATREALARRGPTLNLLGGFHHAAPDRGGGLCALNDIAVAVAAVRAEGVTGRVVVLDLDAHPPDGLAACLAEDPSSWIGSLSGASWGPLLGTVDETVLPVGTSDTPYLEALAALLRRMPAPALAFVIAGGDVLAGDELGVLGLSLDGARRRDASVARALRGIPTVWLPGGGYHEDAWKILAGTGLVLAGHGADAVQPADPMGARFAQIARELDRGQLAGDDLGLSLEDLEGDLGGRPRQRRMLGAYSAEGIEYALERYGLLSHVARLGYTDFRVAVDQTSVGDRARLFGRCRGAEHLLVETVLERRAAVDGDVLFVHWLNLRHPMAVGSGPLLPGQDVPGLGMSREMAELFARIAERLGLSGVAFRPSHYHLAYAARTRFRFLDARRQGRFEALLRDLADLPLAVATSAVADGRVLLDGEPYTWEADDMVALRSTRPDEAEIAAERERTRFTVAPR